jgi:hypothetical protein
MEETGMLDLPGLQRAIQEDGDFLLTGDVFSQALLSLLIEVLEQDA